MCFEVSAQVPFLGACPATTAVTDFDLNKYLGMWYEIRSFPAIFQLGATCVQAKYSLNSNGTVEVDNRGLQHGKPIKILGNAELVTPGIGKLIVNFPSTGAPRMFPVIKF